MTANLLELRGIRAAYDRIDVLFGIDLAVPQGSVVALLGPNGAGKTTLLKIFSSLVLPDEGRARVGGHDTIHENRVKRQLGVVPQEPALYENLSARENLRFERTRVFGRARQILLELGNRFAALDCIETPRDVFYLEIDEVLGFVEGRVTTTDLKGLVALRKAEFARWQELPAPADRFETRGIIYKGHTFGSERAAVQPTGDSLKGLGCCPGIVRGPVRVVREPKSAVVQHGDIIVAERTDPGWVMIFPAASGLLVERGSLLSHSAIVARELGLPTIVSLAGVTAWLKDGDWVEMDGAKGVVAKVAAPGAPQADASA